MKWVAFPVLAACAPLAFAVSAAAGPHDELVAKHAAANGVPVRLVHRVIHIESRGNPSVVHAGNYGLMQIRLGTARGIGYSGDAKGLLDPDTNLTYAVKYLAGAYRAAGCDENRAVSYYQRGYYGVRQAGCATAVVANPTDVIKPKLVRVETIGSAAADQTHEPAGTFEPLRGAVSSEGAGPTAAPQLLLASVPLPPARPEFDPTSKSHHVADHADKRAARLSSKPAEAEKPSKTDGPTAVVTFLKKLVTPDKTAVKSVAQEQAALDPPSQVQPPQ